MDIKTFRKYRDKYLETDVLLLADAFENYRKLGLREFGLDPAWNFIVPGQTWDAMLKCVKTKLELFTDPNMSNFVEMGIRGSVSMVSTRYAKANNK